MAPLNWALRQFTFRKRTLSLVLVSILILCSFVYMLHASEQYRRIQRRSLCLNKAIRKCEQGIALSMPELAGIELPPQLRYISTKECLDIVKTIRSLSIRNVVAPHTPSLIRYGEGYLLFFQYDTINPSSKKTSFIGVAELDEHFAQTSREFQTLDLGTDSAENPKIIASDQGAHLFFSAETPLLSRRMHIATVDLDTLQVGFKSPFEINQKHQEKFWSPFVFKDIKGNQHLYCEYSISPHKIYTIENPEQGTLKECIYPHSPSPFSYFLQRHPLWGDLRPGSTAIDIGAHYLNVCSCTFKDEHGINWELMRAYLFQKRPPFRIQAVAEYPILFQKLFETPPSNGANPLARTISPSSLLLSEVEGKQYIHLACTENHAQIKIVTLELEKLLKKLKPID